MAQLLYEIKQAFFFRSSKKITIANTTFKISTQLTPGLLILASILVCATDFFGHPIKCDPGAVCSSFVFVIIYTITM